MLTNPLVTTPAAEADGDRPALRIAARATPPASDAQSPVPAPFSEAPSGWKAEVAGLLEKISDGAAADAAHAAAHARAQAQVQINELEQQLIALKSSMDALRASAEAERTDLQRGCRESLTAAEERTEALRMELAGYKAELVVVRQQLDAAIAERSKLTATFRLVQRALAVTTPEILPETLEATAAPAIAAPEAIAPDRPAAEVVAAEVVIEAPAEAVDDVRRVLEQVETMYLQDLESGRSGIEIADRLTASLRHARAMVIARWSIDEVDAPRLFEGHLGLLLDKHNGTLFGRHLSIAAYASRTSE